MAERPLRVLQINSRDNHGGAARIAWGLHQAYLQQGHQAWMAVGAKFSDDERVALIPNEQVKPAYVQILRKVRRYLRRKRLPGSRALSRIMAYLIEPERIRDTRRGIENFHAPGTWHIFDRLPEYPDIIHAHNLHRNYFDLRALPWLSQQAPMVLTLHDAWLLSGHCSHSFSCDRWKTGCGLCPDLTIYPEVEADATDFNWQRKAGIYARSRLFITTPSQWLLNMVQQSMLMAGTVEYRVIPNGIDLETFCPADKKMARAKLDIPQDSKVVLFVAEGIRANIFKDYETMGAAVTQVADQLGEQNLIFLALGEEDNQDRIGPAELRFVPYQPDPARVAQYYQAADVYIHAARADTFPTVILEALACGTPVVATKVGGIPEQVKALNETDDQNNATGMLIGPGDAPAMAIAIQELLLNDLLREQLATNAVQDARERFDIKDQVRHYLTWYQEVIDCWQVKTKSQLTKQQFLSQNTSSDLGEEQLDKRNKNRPPLTS